MAFKGCLVKKASDLTAVNYAAQTAIAWDTEVYDTDGAHDNVTANTQITIPAAWNGLYGIVTLNFSAALVTLSRIGQLNILKNGATYPGAGITTFHHNGNGQSSTSLWANCSTTPQLLTTGDIWTARAGLFNDTSITVVAAESSFGIYVHENLSPRMQVLACRNADQTTANYTAPTAIVWDGADVYDTDNIHTSPSSQLIIPAALNGKYVIVGAVVVATDTAGNKQHSIAIRKNGSLSYSGMGAKSDNSQAGTVTTGESRIGAWTQPIQVATGDTFDALFYVGTDTSITIKANKSSFGLRVVG